MQNLVKTKTDLLFLFLEGARDWGSAEAGPGRNSGTAAGHCTSPFGAALSSRCACGGEAEAGGARPRQSGSARTGTPGRP